MHDHDPGSSNFLSRSSYQHGNDLLSDTIVKPQHQLHHHSFHHLPQHHAHLRQQNVHQHVGQSQQHHLSLQLQHQQHQQHRNVNMAPHHLPHPFAHHESATSAPYHHLQQYHPQLHPSQSATGMHQDGQHMYHPTFTPSSHLTSSAESCNIYGDEEDQFEDVDEEDISEVDDEELLRTYEQCRRRIQSRAPDMTSQLLHFASMVSADIQKFFGRSKGNEDGCDIYEDKWATTKSGRELYYADLLRIAQGDSEPVSKTTRKSSASTSAADSNDQSTTSRHSGKRNISAGMGPLNELFQFGLQNFSSSSHKKHYSSKSKGNHGHKARFTPMQERNFPASFWREPFAMSDAARGEPCTDQAFNTSAPLDSSVQPAYVESCPASGFGDRVRNEHRQGVVMTSSKLLDFADLMESWQVVDGGGGDVGEGLTDTGHDRRQHLIATTLEHHRL